MPTSADPAIVKEIRRLASDPTRVLPFGTAKWDMLAYGLTTDDVCGTIIEWIDAGERVKPTVIKKIPQFQGMPAYEMKPRIDSILFYIKVMLQEVGSSGERMLLISVHPDH
jgi:hypothetical protein